MIIKWYNCSDDKRMINKTMSFVDSSTCNIFGSCSMDNPSFIVDSVKGNYVSFNNKCYFVNSTSYLNGKWVITCTADDLINHRNELLNLNALIARSEIFQNKDIVDNLITVKSQRQTIGDSYGVDVISKTDTDYIIGVI